MRVRSEEQLTRRLEKLEGEMVEQAELCRLHGYHSHYAVMWDKRCVERATLRWTLGMKRRPFNAADTLAGW